MKGKGKTPKLDETGLNRNPQEKKSKKSQNWNGTGLIRPQSHLGEVYIHQHTHMRTYVRVNLAE